VSGERHYRIATTAGPSWARSGGRSDDLLLPVAHLGWPVSGVMTLPPGDIISTGSPAGVSPIRPGDVVEVERVGVPRNPVIER
jgi:2-keto-4-pentenoate hydratase/2-oxohepta-3-ene-1,7-dioic acid hydratase in catechol pathway